MMRINAARQRMRDNRVVVTHQGIRGAVAFLEEGRMQRARIVREHKTFPGRMLSEIVRDGAWTGQRCFCIGGGPSLRGFDWGRLRGELVIGINRAFEVIDPAFLYSMDTRFYSWATHNALPASATMTPKQLSERFAGLRATKTWLLGKDDYLLGKEVFGINRDECVGSKSSICSGFYPSDNSGYGALCLALALGASEIYLLGYDMGGGRGGNQAWFHSGYNIVQGSYVYAGMIGHFERHAEAFKQRSRIINLNPASNLRCFEFGNVEELTFAPVRPLVVGFYTRGTGYESEAAEMVRSAHRMGLETDVRGIESRGSWVANCAAKAEFVRDMMDAHPDRALLYVDADARFRRYPALFDGCGLGDFACHHLRGTELLSGTLYFAPTQPARALVEAWIAEGRADTTAWDQWTLDRALQGWIGDARELPAEYTRIFDNKFQCGVEPIIEHMQASRSLKKEAGR